MTDEHTVEHPPVRIFPAKVVKVLDDFRVAINRGSEHGVKKGQRFLVYYLSKEEIQDPDTLESLGFLEIVRGIGKVVHMQEKMSTLASDEREPREVRTIKRSPLAWQSMFEKTETEIVETPSEIKPFAEPQIGDLAKPI